MKENKNPQPKAPAKKAFDIGKDVEWVNGENVKGKTTISLTEKEAAFDLANGRIKEKSPAAKK